MWMKDSHRVVREEGGRGGGWLISRVAHHPKGLFSVKSHGSCIVPVHKAWKPLHIGAESTVLLQILVDTLLFGPQSWRSRRAIKQIDRKTGNVSQMPQIHQHIAVGTLFVSCVLARVGRCRHWQIISAATRWNTKSIPQLWLRGQGLRTRPHPSTKAFHSGTFPI